MKKDYATYYCNKCKEYFSVNFIPKIFKGAHSFDVLEFTCPKCGLTATETTPPKREDYIIPKTIKEKRNKEK